jgi:hypothetical protein
MGILILLALLALITWNVLVQVGARQQATISTSDDVASARRTVSAAFGTTWTRATTTSGRSCGCAHRFSLSVTHQTEPGDPKSTSGARISQRDTVSCTTPS